jgi:hypothetical protein
MKTCTSLTVLTLAALLFGCKANHHADAKIFERKEVEGNKLMIKYNYQVAGKPHTDSAIIKNKVLEGDTITVKYKASQPGNATPASVSVE